MNTALHSASSLTSSASPPRTRHMRLIGLAMAVGGAAWVMKYVLVVGSQAGAHWQPACAALGWIGLLLPAGLALAFMLGVAGRANGIARLAAFVVALVTTLMIAGLSVVSIQAFARALLTDAPGFLIQELPTLVMGLTGLLVAPLLWLAQGGAHR